VANVEEAARRGGAFCDEYRLQRGDGSYALILDRGLTLKDEFGRPTHMVGVMRDVTREREAELALRESAELYQTLFEKAANPAFHIDQTGRYLDANEAGLAFLETTEEELRGSEFVRHWGADAYEALQGVIAGDGSSKRFDVEITVGDTSKAVILTLTPCHVGGQLTCFALATDISDRRALQRALVESNTALRVILDQRNRDRAELEMTIQANVASMVLPLLSRLRRPLSGEPEAAYLDTAVHNLQEIVRPIAQTMNPQAGPPLTLREREIANLIRAGKTTAEIASALYISPGTVAFHRKNLRRKFGLDAHGARLSSHLASLPALQ
jgi:PAS domain S-box-containing protein